MSQQAGGATSGVISGNQCNMYVSNYNFTAADATQDPTAGFKQWGPFYETWYGATVATLQDAIINNASGDMFRIRDAKEGCTVRWTDPDTFPMLDISTMTNQILFYTEINNGQAYMMGMDDNDNPLQLYVRKSESVKFPASGNIGWLSSHAAEGAGSILYCLNGRTPGYNARSLGSLNVWMRANLPYIVVEGLQPGQQVTLQMSWHLECEPKRGSAIASTASPVDAGFNTTIMPMLGDRLAFPIVVKGHSFFSKLGSAIRGAAKTVGSILSTGSKVASGLSADPRVQAISMAGGAAGNALQNLSNF